MPINCNLAGSARGQCVMNCVSQTASFGPARRMKTANIKPSPGGRGTAAKRWWMRVNKTSSPEIVRLSLLPPREAFCALRAQSRSSTIKMRWIISWVRNPLAAGPSRQTTIYLPLNLFVLYHTRRIAVKESADSPEFLYFLLNLSEKALQTAQNML